MLFQNLYSIIYFVIALTRKLLHNSINNLRARKKNCKLSTDLRAYASHTDRSNSQPSLMDTHRMSKIDMLGNSISSELTVYPRKLVFCIAGIPWNYNSSTLLSPPQGRWQRWHLHLEKGLRRERGDINIFLNQEETKS